MNTKEKLLKYFNHKSKELLEIANQAITVHNGLKGEHREAIINNYLTAILPSKYSITTGELVGIETQLDYVSNQADIIIWDSFNYPKISLIGSNLIFAESAKMVVEIKSNFNSNEWSDIKNKTRKIKEFIPSYHSTLHDEIWRLDNKIARAIKGKPEMTMMASAPLIGMSAICFFGGKNFSIDDISNTNEIEDFYPDLLILVEEGKILFKSYEILEYGKQKGFLNIFEAKENALLGFTSLLMSLLAERDSISTSPFQLINYLNIFPKLKGTTIEFPVTRIAPGVEIID